VAAASRPTAHGIPVGLELHAPAFALALVSPLGSPSQTAHQDSVGELALLHSTTLLRLHCALNL